MTLEDERDLPDTPSSSPHPSAAAAQSQQVLAKAGRENFPVAPFFLPPDARQDLLAVYGFARLVDDIGDGDLPPGRNDAVWLGLDGPTDDRLALLDAFEQDLHRVFDGTPGHPLLRALVPTVRRHRIGPAPFLALVEANRQDQTVRRYASYPELLEYCTLSANPVGHLVLRITDRESPQRIRCSDAICTALQIAEHLQDVAEDLARDRIYLPADDMARFGVTESDLARPTANTAVRKLIAFEAGRARELLHEGTPLVGSVHGRLRLLLAGFVAGGHAALDAVAAADHDVLPGPPRASKFSVLREVLATLRRKR